MVGLYLRVLPLGECSLASGTFAGAELPGEGTGPCLPSVPSQCPSEVARGTLGNPSTNTSTGRTRE